MTAPRLLIVEDDESLRLIVQMQLTKRGYETVSAPNAEQAVEVLKQSRQNLVITDLHLPGMSGMELLKTIRAEFPGTAVIVLTAFGTVESAVDCHESRRSGLCH